MKNVLLKTLIVVSTLWTVTACQSTTGQNTAQTPAVSCPEVSGVDLADATQTVKSALQTGQCSHKFADYYEGLMTIAAGAPAKANKGVFSDFIGWSYTQQLISKRDAETYFSRYFGEGFISLDDTYNTCSLSSKQDELISALNSEMKDKKRGILTVLGNKELFADVSNQHAALRSVLEATWMACDS